jgi:IS30 family transposase
MSVMKSHTKLHLGDRIEIADYHSKGLGCRAISRLMARSCSTISVELRRLSGCQTTYDAVQADAQATQRRCRARFARKLSDEPLWSRIRGWLLNGLSPEQIAGQLKVGNGGKSVVSPETIYQAIYLIPRGELRKDLIACMRQGRSTRRPRTRGKDRRGKISDMQSIHIRPPEVESRQIPGHWEGDLIKGARNQSSVGTLVERTTGFVVLVKMSSATAADALESFAVALETIPPALRKTLTYDQGREMSYHTALTLRTGVEVFFADPHSPWQRGSNENTNGLLRQYLPKGTDLSTYSQDELNIIAHSLNTRPRKRHKFRTPLELYNNIIQLDQTQGLTIQ